jgi:hypothetical protein
MKTSNYIHSATDLHINERGGLTAAAGLGSNHVARFAFVKIQKTRTNNFQPGPFA